MENCEHINIVVMIEIPKNSNYPITELQERKRYFVCEDCGKHLPINRITQQIIEVDIIG